MGATSWVDPLSLFQQMQPATGPNFLPFLSEKFFGYKWALEPSPKRKTLSLVPASPFKDSRLVCTEFWRLTVCRNTSWIGNLTASSDPPLCPRPEYPLPEDLIAYNSSTIGVHLSNLGKVSPVVYKWADQTKGGGPPCVKICYSHPRAEWSPRRFFWAGIPFSAPMLKRGLMF